MNKLITVVLDETGSMQEIQEATISAYNEYFDSLRKEEGEIAVSLTLFSDHQGINPERVRQVFTALPIQKVPKLSKETYRPNGVTPLYDAIGSTIRSTEKWIEGQPQAPEQVLFVIQTDGYENASREFTQYAIHTLLQEKEKESGWTFVYLGANQDAWAVGRSLGIKSQTQTLSYSADEEGIMFAASSLTLSTSNYLRAGSKGSTPFFPGPEEEGDKRKKPGNTAA